MADAPESPKAKGRPGRKKGQSEYTAADKAMAYQLWLEHDKPSLHEVARLMAAKGKPVDTATILRWKDRNPAWLALFQQKANPMDVGTIADALALAKQDATALEAEHFLGIKAQLVARLYLSARTMTFTDIDQWQKALESCERIEALIHTERGKTVTEGRTGKPASILEAVAPSVNIAPFKKPNGGAA